jgi:hypothetical protein
MGKGMGSFAVRPSPSRTCNGDYNMQKIHFTFTLPVFQILGLTLIGLKLSGQTDLNWFWVLLPFMLDIVIQIGVGVIAAMVEED